MSYSSEVLADTPVVYWTLDDTSGTSAVDSSGNSLTGTYTGTPTLSATHLITTGTAVTFASGQYMSRAASALLNANNAVTVEAWIKTSSSGAIAMIVCGDLSSGIRYFQFRVTSAGKFEFIVFDNTASNNGNPFVLTGVTSVNDNVKHHLVGTYDGTTIRIYVDGIQDNSSAQTFTLATASPQITLAIASNTTSNPFPGTIDEVAIYTSALSSSRIVVHYSVGAGANIDIATTSTKTSISSTEAISDVESATIKSTTTPSGVDSLGRTDAATIASTTTVTGVDVSASLPDAATISTVTVVTANERGPFHDSDTLSTITTIPVGEYNYVHPTGWWGVFDDDDGIII